MYPLFLVIQKYNYFFGILLFAVVRVHIGQMLTAVRGKVVGRMRVVGSTCTSCYEGDLV